jgi:hypothetical protein
LEEARRTLRWRSVEILIDRSGEFSPSEVAALSMGMLILKGF